MHKRGQAGFEYLAVFVIVFTLVATMTYFYFYSSQKDEGEIQKKQANEIGYDLVALSEDMFQSPGFAKRHTKYSIPERITNISVENRHTLVIEVAEGENSEDMVFVSEAPIGQQIDLDMIAGGYITLTATDEAVVICTGECDCSATTETDCNDAQDNDCDGWADECDEDCNPGLDLDGDGWNTVCGVPDCDDTDPLTYPFAHDFCGDGIDQDCDGSIDEGCGGTCATCAGVECGDIPDPNCFGTINCGNCGLHGSCSLNTCSCDAQHTDCAGSCDCMTGNPNYACVAGICIYTPPPGVVCIIGVTCPIGTALLGS